METPLVTFHVYLVCGVPSLVSIFLLTSFPPPYQYNHQYHKHPHQYSHMYGYCLSSILRGSTARQAAMERIYSYER